MNKYKILPPKIKRGKFIYHLIKREGMVALFDQEKIGSQIEFVVMLLLVSERKKRPNYQMVSCSQTKRNFLQRVNLGKMVGSTWSKLSISIFPL